MTTASPTPTALASSTPPPARRTLSQRLLVRSLVGGLTVAHGAVHLIGAAAGLGLAQVDALDVAPAAGLVWLAAGLLVIAAGVGLLAGRRRWWALGAVGVVLSQVLLVTDWTHAAAGTVANVILLAAVVHGWSAEGPRSLRTRYRTGAEAAVATLTSTAVLTEADLAALPAQVAGYLRRTGAVGQPRVRGFRARISGRIRGGPDQPWMAFTGEQVNTFGAAPTRHFWIDATMRGVPVDVLHVLADGHATMRVVLCSIVPMVDAAGPEMDRAETVTLFNDLCLLAPAGLVDAPVTWTPIGDRSVHGTYTHGEHTVGADLIFDDRGDLVDFVSDDRLRASADGSSFTPTRWSTPVGQYRTYGERRLGALGQAVWHADAPEGTFAYLEFVLEEMATELATGRPARAGAA